MTNEDHTGALRETVPDVKHVQLWGAENPAVVNE